MTRHLDVSCPACGNATTASVQNVPDREYGIPGVTAYASCAICGTLFQQPMAQDSELSSFYPVDYHSMTSQGMLAGARHDLRLRQLRKLGAPDGPLLDFGCGNGDFLIRAAARAQGREYYGFELSDGHETTKVADGAVTLIRADFATLLEDVPQCAIVTMNHVIEHLPDPLATVSALREKLVPGGILEGQTPASDSLEHRVFRTRWSGYHAPRHTVVFSRTGLTRLLERAGYVGVKVRRGFNPAGLAVSLASVPQGSEGGTVHRSGLRWLVCLGLGTTLAPIDLLGGSGIANFSARRPDRHD